jgi:iron complex outermembrane recepter protein
MASSSQRPARLLAATAIASASFAFAVPALAQEVSGSAEQQAASSTEIMVTAQRREQAISDVPQAVQAVSGERLQSLGIEQIEDVIALVPSATIGSTISVGSNVFQIRGVAAAETDGDPTIGFYLDNFAFSLPGRPYAPAVDFYDLQRVEVLRGPSGTLYGLGSLGGTIKVLTNDPDLYAVQGSARLTGNITDGGQPGGSGDAMINVPLAEGKSCSNWAAGARSKSRCGNCSRPAGSFRSTPLSMASPFFSRTVRCTSTAANW